MTHFSARIYMAKADGIAKYIHGQVVVNGHVNVGRQVLHQKLTLGAQI